MSVIVKGMEMPRGCEDCFIADQIGIGRCRISKRIWDPDPGQPLRPYWCPLRPLPEKHGRLIDGSALQSSFIESISGCRDWIKEAEESNDSDKIMIARQSFNTFIEAALRTKGMETIVEAEVG